MYTCMYMYKLRYYKDDEISNNNWQSKERYWIILDYKVSSD